MAARGRTTKLQLSAGLFVAGAVTFAVVAPASAQNIFERLFGGFRREAPAGLPADIHAFGDPYAGQGSARPPRPAASTATGSGPATGYCVRTCDGHFFPVQAHPGVSAAEACHAFCPASQTRLYSGNSIDYAVASDGSRYADLDTAFLYRQQLVAGCTCNGRDPFGLAHVDVNSDPTLRPGDIVATKSGLMAFTGMKNKTADFTPIDSYRGLTKGYRDKLSQVKIMPPNPGALNATPVSLSGRARADENRRAQLSR